jgi:phenylalanine-4-hydroxylase
MNKSVDKDEFIEKLRDELRLKKQYRSIAERTVVCDSAIDELISRLYTQSKQLEEIKKNLRHRNYMNKIIENRLLKQQLELIPNKINDFFLNIENYIELDFYRNKAYEEKEKLIKSLTGKEV